MTYTLVWTNRAVGTYRRQLRFDPRHTVRNYPADIDSPWLESALGRKLRSPWILVEDTTGHIVKGSRDYVHC